MSKKRILIVDDDKSILRMLEFGLKKLGSTFQFITANDIYNALEQIEKEWFDLVITDYMMPGMTGVDLARAVRRISPDTQVVLMTAYGSSELRNTTDNLGIDGFLNKPFTMEQIREVVLSISHRDQPEEEAEPSPVVEASPPKSQNPPVSTEPKSADKFLQKLQVDAGAQSVMLISSEGNLIQVAGQIDSSKTGDICSLVAANFYSPVKLAGLLDNQKPFKAGFYEGDSYNLYVCEATERYLLAVIFDVRLRPGVVWFYTKQTATQLALLLD